MLGRYDARLAVLNVKKSVMESAEGHTDDGCTAKADTFIGTDPGIALSVEGVT